MCTLELENEYIYRCVYGWRVLLVYIYIYIYIYVYYFVGNNGVLLGIKFMFIYIYIYERIEVLNKKEVKFF